MEFIASASFAVSGRVMLRKTSSSRPSSVCSSSTCQPLAAARTLARQVAVDVFALGINPRPDFAFFLFDDRRPAGIGHAR